MVYRCAICGRIFDVTYMIVEQKPCEKVMVMSGSCAICRGEVKEADLKMPWTKRKIKSEKTG